MLKILKSLFIVEEEAAKNEESVTSSSPPAEADKRDPVMSQSVKGEAGRVSSKFTDILLVALEKNNIKGFDYLEYKKSLQQLAKMPMDEQTRYQSAFAMASTMGATPQNLVETAQHYINVLKQEEKKFEEAVNNQRSQQIGNKEQQIKQLTSIIQNKAEQIKKLTQEIEEHQQQENHLRQEISKSTVKMETTKNNFIASYNALVKKIYLDVENMKKYLK